MKLLKNTAFALFATVTLTSGSLSFAQRAFADTSDSMVATSSVKAPVVNRAITEAEVLSAQQSWGDALVLISKTYEINGKESAKALAEKVIDEAYGYQFGVFSSQHLLLLHRHSAQPVQER